LRDGRVHATAYEVFVRAANDERQGAA
jgi:hypothetical protein